MSSNFRLALPVPSRKRSGSVTSLHFARSGGRSGPGSISSEDDGPRKSLSFTPIRDERRGSASRATLSPVASTPTANRTTETRPESPSSPPDIAAWAADTERLANKESPGRPSHESLRSVHSADQRRARVQFAEEDCVEVYEPEGYGFERPEGKEIGYLITSIVVLVLLTLAAGLTTIFDWVL